MPELKTYRLFISHAWHRDADYSRIVDFLNAAPNFKWCNHSVPSTNPLDAKTDKQLEEEIRGQISGTHAVIILSGMYVAHSKWIQKEIDIAVAMGKPIIGIKPWGNQVVPTAVSSVAKIVVAWQTSSIVDAIRKYAL